MTIGSFAALMVPKTRAALRAGMAALALTAASAPAHAAVRPTKPVAPAKTHVTSKPAKGAATKTPSAKAHGTARAEPIPASSGKHRGTAKSFAVRQDIPETKSSPKGHGKAAKPAAPATKKNGKQTAGRAVTPLRSGTKPNAASSTSHGRKPRVVEADEVDPPLLYRARTETRTPLRRALPAPEQTPAEEAAARVPEALPPGHHNRRPVRPAAEPATDSSTAPRVAATNEDFLRAAGIAREDPKAPDVPEAPRAVAAKTAAAPAEVMERGESHPDDDVRVNINLPNTQVPATHVLPDRHVTKPGAVPVAVMSPAPEAPTPAGKETLPEELHSLAVKADATAKADLAAVKAAGGKGKSARVSILPDDPAERDAVIEAAMQPQVLPHLYGAGGRLIVPPPMKGTHDILVHQNTMADSDGLTRIQDDDDLNRMRAAHLLVAFPEIDALEINSDLPLNRRYARPWTERFVVDTARAYYAHFGQALRLNSAVRTVTYQLRLQRVNGNAAAVDGDGASPHLTGQAVDLGKRGMTVAEIAWMRAYLGPIMDAGKIDVEEEFQQACFHISVYRSYLPAVKAKAKPAATMQVAQTHAAPIVRRTPKLDEDQ